MTVRMNDPSRPNDALHCIARRLSEAIDHAVQRGMFEQADRLAANAMRLATHSLRLADRLARLRLLQGDPEAAMAILEACATQSSSMRLLRIACLVQIGRVVEAHLDLHEWSTHTTAPMAARRMLALMEASVDDFGAATAALARNLQHVEDPDSLELLTLLCIRDGRSEQAQHWLARLRQSCIVAQPAIDVQFLCDSLDIANDAQAQPVHASPKQVETLAMELAASPEALPVLVQAQERECQPIVAELIYAATERAIGDLNNQSTAFEALVRLALLLDRADAAIDWARRGLQANPMSAPLALLLAELEGEPAAEPTETTHRKAA